ncbi:transposase [Clostridium estertheticum]|uniref:transposase n=1 Tax=Clostridium estertheticum TaxID=238834 RepID=UPI00124E919E|nr:transposase [Clostridium estertheticum subsp. laramiense]WAG76278.1 transposase [Clostridium estertheticum]
MTLTANELISRFIMHILPSRFNKIRPLWLNLIIKPRIWDTHSLHFFPNPLRM